MIIGLTGTLGGGKGTVAEYLFKKHNFTYLSVRNYIAGEAVRRGLMVNHENLVKVGNALRAEHHSGWLIEQILNEALSQSKVLKQKDIVVESIRTVGEVEILKKYGARLWAVDADATVRYNRTVKRAGEKDAPTLEQFTADEATESTSQNQNEANISAVMQLADTTFTNNGTQAELFAAVDAALAALKTA
jgi:dephospho-CoA kinase